MIESYKEQKVARSLSLSASKARKMGYQQVFHNSNYFLTLNKNKFNFRLKTKNYSGNRLYQCKEDDFLILF